jgi:hypothetical protein
VDGFLVILPLDVDVTLALVAAGMIVAGFLLAGAPVLRRAVSDVDPNQTVR